MATPSQIRASRKRNLREVKASLKDLDSMLERLERLINRILRVRKRFPDEEDAAEIIKYVSAMDQLLNSVSTKAIKFSQIVRSF